MKKLNLIFLLIFYNSSLFASIDEHETCSNNPNLDLRISSCTSLLKTNQKDILNYAYLNRGIAYYYKNQFEKSVEDFTNAIKYDLSDFYSYYYRSKSYFKLGNDNNAYLDINKAIEFDKEKTLVISYVERSNYFLKFGLFDKAKSDLDFVINFSSKRYTRSDAEDHNLSKALIEAFRLRGILYAKSNDMINAYKDFDNYYLNLKDKNIYNLLLLADELFHKKNFIESIIKYDEVISLAHYYRLPYYYKALALYENGDYYKSINIFNDLLKFDPENIDYLYRRAECYFKLGNLEMALMDYNNSITIKANYLSFIGRGDIMLKNGDFIRAIADYNEALRIQPNNFLALNNRGYAYYKSGNTFKALDDYNSSIKYNSNYSISYFYRGILFENKGDLAQALTDFRYASRLNPRNKTINDYLFYFESKLNK